MTEPITPTCPGCGSHPRFLLDDGRQAICGNDACQVLMWNPTLTAAQNMADAQVVGQVIDPPTPEQP